MAKRLMKTIILIGAIATTASAVSFGYFCFDKNSTGNNEAVQDLRVDDIYENYDTIMQNSGGSKLNDTTYTFYIYPSSEYVQIYNNYLVDLQAKMDAGKTYNQAKKAISTSFDATPSKRFKTYHPAPEDFNGHIELTYKDNGSIITDYLGNPVVTSPINHFIQNDYHHPDYTKGDKTYKADRYVQYVEETYTRHNEKRNLYAKRTVGMFNYMSQHSSVIKEGYSSITEDSMIFNGESYYVTPDGGIDYWESYEKDMYHPENMDANYRISGQAGFQRRLYDAYEFTALHGTNAPSSPGYRTYGHPDDINVLDEKVNLPINLKNQYHRIMNGLDHWDDGPQDQNKCIFGTDRFGAWDFLSMEEGRFAPIKFTVNNSISPQAFNKAFGDLITTMNDGNKSLWFESNFAGFVYAKHNLDSKNNKKIVKDFPLRNLATNLKKPNDVQSRDLASGFDTDNLFDISRSLSFYADEDNIIRLFPTFSSGKGYWAQSFNKNDPKEEALSLKYGGKDQIKINVTQSNNKTHEIIKSTNRAPLFIGDYNQNAPAYRYNFDNTGSNYADFDVSCAYMNSIPINVRGTETKISIEIHVANGSGSWQGQKVKPYILDFSDKNIFNKINDSGYYNLYLLIGNAGKKCANNPENNIPNLNEYVDSLAYTKKFPDLEGKKMWNFPCEKSVVDYYDPVGGYATQKDSAGVFRNNRPIYLMFQKATEPKVYMGLDPIHTSINDINTEINSMHDDAPTAYNIQRPLYCASKRNAQGKPTEFKQVYKEDKNDPNNINTQNLTFIFKNLDFTDTTSNFFQMRFGNAYNKAIRYNLNDGTNGVPNSYDAVYAHPTIHGVPSAAEQKNFVEFLPAFGKNSGGFFKRTYVNQSYKDNKGQVHTAKVPYIELANENCRGVYDIILSLNDKVTPNDSSTIFDVYVYRHTNIFVKLFAEDPTSYKAPTTETDILFIDHGGKDSSKNLWEKRCFIGDALSASATDNTDLRKDQHITVDDVIKKEMTKLSKRGINYDNLIIRDHVTGTPIAWYELIDPNYKFVNEADKLKPEHFEIVFNENFKIMKNHILYITKRGLAH